MGHIGAPLNVVAGSLLDVAMSPAAFTQIGSAANVFGAVVAPGTYLWLVGFHLEALFQSEIGFTSGAISLCVSGMVASPSWLDRLRVSPRSFVLGALYPVSALLVLMTISA